MGVWCEHTLSRRSQIYAHLSCLVTWSEVKWKSLSLVQLFATPWTIQSLEFSRQEYWSGRSFPSPGNVSNSGIEPRSPALQADSLPTEISGKPQFLKSSFKKAGSAEKSLTQTILTYPKPPLGGGFSTLVPLLWRGDSQVMLLLLLSHFSRVRLCATP